MAIYQVLLRTPYIQIFSVLKLVSSLFPELRIFTSVPRLRLRTPFVFFPEDLQLHSKYVFAYSAKLSLSCFFKLVKIIESCKRFCKKLFLMLLRSSPRPISIGQLHALLHLHLRPINLVVFKGSYYLTIWDILS